MGRKKWKAVLKVYVDRLDDFEIIDWNRFDEEEREDVESTTKDVGRFMYEKIKESGVCYDWGLREINYEEKLIKKTGKHCLTYRCVFYGETEEDGADDEAIENPLHIFGLDGETRCGWL